jgi:hypothetical protein
MFAVTPEQIEQFREDGFLIVENLIDDETIEALRARYERLFRGEFETGITPDEVNWQEGESDPTLSRQICNGWKADRTIARVVLRQDLGHAVAQLGGWPGVRIMVDNVIWKPPDTRSLAHHQDSAYLSWYTPSDLLSCWMALDDTTADGGTIEFVRGSHKWHRSKPEGEFHGPEDYRKYMKAAAAAEPGTARATTGRRDRGARWSCTPCAPIPSTYQGIWAKGSAASTAATSTSPTTRSTRTTFPCCGARTVTGRKPSKPIWQPHEGTDSVITPGTTLCETDDKPVRHENGCALAPPGPLGSTRASSLAKLGGGRSR